MREGISVEISAADPVEKVRRGYHALASMERRAG
jgi:hypothetical protein